jgi:hypothetical protein
MVAHGSLSLTPGALQANPRAFRAPGRLEARHPPDYGHQEVAQLAGRLGL